jgi:hypothetical protein
MANGVLVSRITTAGKTTWRWRERDPMAAVVDFYSSIYGPYPFDAVGAIVVEIAAVLVARHRCQG